MISDAGILDEATKLLRARRDSRVAKRQIVLVRKGGYEAVRCEVGERPIPKGIDEDQAGVEIAIEEDDESILSGVNQSASIVQHRRQISDRVPREFCLGQACCPQMPTLDVLKVGSVIDDVSDQ